MRSLLAAATAILALGAAAPAALAAPSVTLTHDPDLVANPTVEVDGTGFVSPTPVLNPGANQIGLYAAQTAIVGGEFVIGDAQEWIRPITFGGSGITLLNNDGTFSSELEVEQVIGTAPDEVDCAAVQCFITTWQAHGNPDEDQLFTHSPIYFAPTIRTDPTTNISASGQTIAVNGGGVSAALIAGNGINMSQIAIVEGEVKTGPARWIDNDRTGANHLTTNGTFTSDLTLSSTFTDGDDTINCGLVQCAVAFWPGHTNPTVEPPAGAGEGQLIASQDISFAYNPSASVDPTTNLPETQQVTISGSGYNPGSPGVYVSQVAQVGDSIVTPPAGGGDTMQWLRPSGPTPAETLNPDGSFETSVTVSRTFQDTDGATVDCTQVQCSVITWRAHTNPSPSTLYTSTSLAFASVKSPEPDPVVRAPFAAKPVKKPARLSRKTRKLTLGAVRCGDAVCRFAKPKWVRVRVGNRKAWLLVTGPKRAGANKPARFGVWMRARVAKRLAGRKTRVRLTIQVRSDSGNTVLRINRLLVGPKRR